MIKLPSPNIKVDKTTAEIDSRIDNRTKTDEMSEKITNICNLLFTDGSKFDKEKTFDEILNYIKVYNRILYSQISNEVYAQFEAHNPEETARKLGTAISNIEKVVEYINTKEYIDKKERLKGNSKKAYEDVEKILMKIWDHVNLAQNQYSYLKPTEIEYKKVFDESITPFKEELVKDVNSQLLTMVSLFTALAFLVFGGISSLGSIFSNHELPLLKGMIIGCVWGFSILNMVFVFLFCVGKMTGLNFKSNQDSKANIVQKYPVVWWSDLIILTILAGSFWTYFIRKENMDSWFRAWCQKYPQIAMCLGFGLIAVVFVLVSRALLKQTWKNGE